MPAFRLLGAQFAIGASAIFARFALEGAGPFAVSALRLGIAALLALAVARRLTPLSRGREGAFALAGLALAVHFATWIASLTYTSVAISTLLVTTTPVWTELYEVMRFRRAPTRAYVFAVALALAGVALIALQRDTPAPQPGHTALGAALALIGSLAIGAYLIVVRDASSLPDGTGLATRAIVARTYAWSALALALAATCAHEGPPSTSAIAAWGGILAMALVSQLLGHTALNAALRDFSPSTIALSTLLEPVIAALLGIVLLRERIAPTAIAGGVLVLLAIATALRSNADADRVRVAEES